MTDLKKFLYNSILDDDRNKMAQFVSKANRSTSEKPITIDLLNKSLFTQFLYRNPVTDDMTTDKYLRESEIENAITLFNIIYEEALCKWDGSRPNSDFEQNKLNRIFRSKSIMAWSEMLHDSICAKLAIYDTEDQERPFYRIMSDNDFKILDIALDV